MVLGNRARKTLHSRAQLGDRRRGAELVLEAVERRDGAKGFLLRDDHVGRHIGQHRRLEEATALGGVLAGGEALRECVKDAVLHQYAVGADAGLAGRADRAAPRLRRGKLLTAISMSASSKTMNGGLPPNSRSSRCYESLPCGKP
jgi:hypothetical protein